jgi:hypothetical protein
MMPPIPEAPLQIINEHSMPGSEGSNNSVMSQFLSDLFQTKSGNQQGPGTIGGVGKKVEFAKGKKNYEKEQAASIDTIGYSVLTEVTLMSSKKPLEWIKTMFSDESASLVSNQRGLEVDTFPPELIDKMRKSLTTYSYQNAS